MGHWEGNNYVLDPGDPVNPDVPTSKELKDRDFSRVNERINRQRQQEKNRQEKLQGGRWEAYQYPSGTQEQRWVPNVSISQSTGNWMPSPSVAQREKMDQDLSRIQSQQEAERINATLQLENYKSYNKDTGDKTYDINKFVQDHPNTAKGILQRAGFNVDDINDAYTVRTLSSKMDKFKSGEGYDLDKAIASGEVNPTDLSKYGLFNKEDIDKVVNARNEISKEIGLDLPTGKYGISLADYLHQVNNEGTKLVKDSSTLSGVSFVKTEQPKVERGFWDRSISGNIEQQKKYESGAGGSVMPWNLSPSQIMSAGETNLGLMGLGSIGGGVKTGLAIRSGFGIFGGAQIAKGTMTDEPWQSKAQDIGMGVLMLGGAVAPTVLGSRAGNKVFSKIPILKKGVPELEVADQNLVKLSENVKTARAELTDLTRPDLAKTYPKMTQVTEESSVFKSPTETAKLQEARQNVRNAEARFKEVFHNTNEINPTTVKQVNKNLPGFQKRFNELSKAAEESNRLRQLQIEQQFKGNTEQSKVTTEHRPFQSSGISIESPSVSGKVVDFLSYNSLKTLVKNLPKVKEGYVRIAHQTTLENALSIKDSGLKSFSQVTGEPIKIGNIASTTSTVPSDLNKLSEFLSKTHKGSGTTVIIDIPKRMYTVLRENALPTKVGETKIPLNKGYGLNPIEFNKISGKYVTAIVESGEYGKPTLRTFRDINLSNAKNPYWKNTGIDIVRTTEYVPKTRNIFEPTPVKTTTKFSGLSNPKSIFSEEGSQLSLFEKPQEIGLKQPTKVDIKLATRTAKVENTLQSKFDKLNDLLTPSSEKTTVTKTRKYPSESVTTKTRINPDDVLSAVKIENVDISSKLAGKKFKFTEPKIEPSTYKGTKVTTKKVYTIQPVETSPDPITGKRLVDMNFPSIKESGGSVNLVTEKIPQKETSKKTTITTEQPKVEVKSKTSFKLEDIYEERTATKKSTKRFPTKTVGTISGTGIFLSGRGEPIDAGSGKYKVGLISNTDAISSIAFGRKEDKQNSLKSRSITSYRSDEAKLIDIEKSPSNNIKDIIEPKESTLTNPVVDVQPDKKTPPPPEPPIEWPPEPIIKQPEPYRAYPRFPVQAPVSSSPDLTSGGGWGIQYKPKKKYRKLFSKQPALVVNLPKATLVKPKSILDQINEPVTPSQLKKQSILSNRKEYLVTSQRQRYMGQKGDTGIVSPTMTYRGRPIYSRS